MCYSGGISPGITHLRQWLGRVAGSGRYGKWLSTGGGHSRRVIHRSRLPLSLSCAVRQAGGVVFELSAEGQDLVVRQSGVVACWQAPRLGLTANEVRERLRYGDWQRLHHGVYATFTGRPDREAQLWGALLRAGPVAVLSHHTAAERHGLLPRPSAAIHVTVAFRPRVRPVRGLARVGSYNVMADVPRTSRRRREDQRATTRGPGPGGRGASGRAARRRPTDRGGTSTSAVGAVLTARTYGELTALVYGPAGRAELRRARPGRRGRRTWSASSATTEARGDGQWLVRRRMQIQVTIGNVTAGFHPGDPLVARAADRRPDPQRHPDPGDQAGHHGRYR